VVDGGEPSDCNGGQTFHRFKKGLHTVSVTGTDFAGNVGTTTKTFRIGPLPVDAQPGTQPGTQPPASARKRTGISVRYSFTGSYAKGNRKLIVRTRLTIIDALVAGRCSGAMRIAVTKLGVAEQSIPLIVDTKVSQCVATRTFRLKRATKGKRVQLSFAFDGNAFYSPAYGSGSKKL
jgi:hypothetical protein